MNDIDIKIDENSGISAEEQQEILTQINGITEKNKKQLSENVPAKKEKIIAKKKGFIFPMTVNIAAAVFLCLGGFLLISFNGKTDEQARTGSVVLNLTERALIEEIRKDTAEQIAAKEHEIEAIASRMEEIDRELLLLYSSNIDLTAEQIASRERLLALQNNFKNELSVLNNERSHILEASRVKEARLRAQLEEQTSELVSAQQKVSDDLEAASAALAKMTAEQEKIAAIDAHFVGSINSIGGLVQNARYDQAAQAAANLRDFLNLNTVTQSASFRVKKEYYNQSLHLMELLISDARRNSAEGRSEELTELTAKNKALEETIDNLQRTVDAGSRGNSGQAQRIREMETTISSLRETERTLRSANTNFERTASEKDRTISSLQNDKTTLQNDKTILQNDKTTLQNENASLTSTNSELRANVTSLTSNVSDLQSRVTSQQQEILNLNNQIAAIRQLLQGEQ